MRAEIFKIDPAHPEPAFARCKEVIRSGGVVVYPTDTLYGLGADPKNPAALRKLFTLKNRQADQPILLLINDPGMVRDWAAEVSSQAGDMTRKFWPGPLTLVFKAKADVLPELTAGTGTIGLRVPGSELCRRLLAFLGTALTGTSANLSGGPNPLTAAEAAALFGNRVDLVLDGGSAVGGRPSTVVDVSGDRTRVIREGTIPSRDIPDWR